MFVSDVEMDTLIEMVTKKVMKIVNKHHYVFREDIAAYRNELRRLEKSFTHFQHQYVNEMNTFNRKHNHLPSKMDEIQEFVRTHSMGVQNVHEKFLQLESRQQDIEDVIKSGLNRGAMKIDLNTCPFEDSEGLHGEWVKLTLIANNTKGSVLLCAEKIKSKDDAMDALLSCVKGLVSYCYGGMSESS